MAQYIDIHTHFSNTEKDVIAVLNHTQKDGFTVVTQNRSSAGLHPWYLTKANFKNDLRKLAQLIENQSVIALGECGLDKLKGEDLDFQIQAFTAQIYLAEAIKKPVIIHCVRAHNEVIAFKKTLKPTVPLIIHGFNQKETILKELLKNGFYISIGAALLMERGGSSAEKCLPNIPLDRLFFETDNTQTSIKTIYHRATYILKMDIDDLKSQIAENFNQILTL